MTTDPRAWSLARLASGLAGGAGIELPASLLLWEHAGGRPAAPAVPSADPAAALGAALEAGLTGDERRHGAHYTPAAVAEHVAALALEGVDPGSRPAVVDPACGAGALLLAAGRRLVAGGVPLGVVARDLLWGADLDPLGAAVTEAAIALWSGGVPPAPGHVVVADTLRAGRAAWPAAPAAGFDAVVGNPPFQGQLARTTARDSAARAALQARFGPAVTPYVDTAALFLLAAVDLARPGARVALVQPQSTAASRDAGAVRAALAERGRLVDLWAPPERLFAAQVHVCVPVLEVGPGEPVPDWVARVASARGVPELALDPGPVVGDVCDVVAGFRDEYYGLVGHVRESAGAPAAPLVTSGLIDVGAMAWGDRPVRFARQRWARPDVDLGTLREASPRAAAWVDRVRRPKVVVATQTRVVEAGADHRGTWVPSTPVVSVLVRDDISAALLAALLNAPPTSVWIARRAAGSALSADALRVTAGLIGGVPLPRDRRAWAAAARALEAGDFERYAERATAMFGLPSRQASSVQDWWLARAKPAWPAGQGLR